jgi:hypothetical protein
MKPMSENDIYCQSRKQTLIEELIAGTNESPDAYKDFSLHQLDQFKARIAANKQSPTIVQQTRSTLDNKNLTIGNSLLGRKMGDTGEPNKFNPSAPIGNQLFGLTVAEVLAKKLSDV